MSDNWVVQMLQSALYIWSGKLAEIWSLMTQSPEEFKGGEIWNVINIIDYHFLGDWESFSREWCAGYGNRIVLKPQLLVLPWD